MFDTHSNFSYEVIENTPGTAGTTVVMGTTNFAQFPDPGTASAYNVMAWPVGTVPLNDNAEILRVTAKGTNGTITVTREQEDTTAKDLSNEYQIAMAVTKKTLTDVEDSLEAEHNVNGTHKVTAFQHINAPEGFLINGKIVPSVTSNNLTVAIKTLSGDDPSATNPVYIRIAGVVRSLTSALSTTNNAGTNWLAMGSTELAAKEVDLFVYLSWNVADENFVIGVSRIPFALRHGDFVMSGANAKGVLRGGVLTNSETNDPYTVIGRFAATLSAAAAHNWSVPTFTSANLIQRPIHETRELTWTPVWTGYSTDPSNIDTRYIIQGNVLHFIMHASTAGTSNANTNNFTIPFIVTPVSDGGAWYSAFDNGAQLTTAGRWVISGGTSTVICYKDFAAGAWTTSNAKRMSASGKTFI
jgi:hypothetical protein